jgi:hypothetical protein
MNYAEEQALEMEALGAIFAEQFSQDAPNACTIIAIPNADTVHVSCALQWTLPPTYPEVVPELVVRNDKGMDDAWCIQLKDTVLTSAKEMVGGPMIFSLVEVAREWLTERNIAGVGEGSMHAKMLSKELETKKALEQQQQQQQAKAGSAGDKSGKGGGGPGGLKRVENGTAVTAESFAKWVNVFVKEETTSLQVTESASKLSGRQLFEKGNLKPEEEEVVTGDVEDFDRNLLMEEDVDLDMLDEDGDLDDEEDEQ